MSWQDWIAVICLILAYAGVLVDSAPTVYTCLVVAGVLECIAIQKRKNLKSNVKVISLLLAIGVTSALIRAKYSGDLEKELKSKEGSILPNATPNPLSKCPVPEDAITIYFGDSVSWTKNFPHTVFTARGENVFVLDKNADGNLLVTVKIFDDRGDLVARLEKNHFIATNAASHMERPNKNSLVIFDHTDQKVLDVQFLNPKAIKITGTLRYPGVRPVVIEEHRLRISNGPTIINSCFGGVHVDFDL